MGQPSRNYNRGWLAALVDASLSRSSLRNRYFAHIIDLDACRDMYEIMKAVNATSDSNAPNDVTSGHSCI